jgi:hypothetical protein
LTQHSTAEHLILPLLPLTSGVVLPGMVFTMAVESDEAKAAVDAAEQSDGRLLLVPHIEGRFAVTGVVMSSLAAFLLWPRDFPATVTQSIHGALNYGGPGLAIGMRNVAFGRALLLIPDGIKSYQTGWGKIPDGFLAGPRSLAGYTVLLVIVAAVLVLGRRIPPVLTGVMLLAGASLFPALVFHYYLVFVLPIAALVVRDPEGPPGSGIFDQLATQGVRRRAVGICVSLAVAVSIQQVAASAKPVYEPVFGPIAGYPGVIGVVGTRPLVVTTLILVPIAWLIACAAIVVSYARRPASCDSAGGGQAQETRKDSATGNSSRAQRAPGDRRDMAKRRAGKRAKSDPAPARNQ